RHLLDRLPLPVSTEEVHPSVLAGGIAPQDVLDQTYRLDVLTPVECGAEAQARDRVRHRHLGGRLALVLVANRHLRARRLRREMRFDRGADRREAEAVLADTMKKLDDR